MSYQSDDPRSVFDQALAFSDTLEMACRVREIGSELRALRERVCGNCAHWMKSNRCPREHNVHGMSRGPSMSALACDKFVDGDEPWKANLETTLRAELRRVSGAKP